MRRWSVGACLAVVCAAPQASPLQQPAQFRAGVILVPIEARAIDADGFPVTDLTADEFTVRADGKVEEVAHFEGVAFDEVGASSGRTFLIVLGRGRLNQPTRALQALVDFVRQSLISGDRIGVVAYLRATEPTTKHAVLARFLEEYRDRHEMIDGLITRDRRRIDPVEPARLAPDTRSSIDELFRRSGLPTRDLAGGGSDAASRYNDVGYLARSLQLLQTLGGEKHLIFVSENRVRLGRLVDSPRDNYWFRMAAVARSSISLIHTGGQFGPAMSRGRLSTRSSGPLLNLMAIKDQELLASHTGGVASFFELAKEPLSRLDRMTRFHYVLGFYASQATPPQQFRTIEVTVSRPGVKLIYRHGYQTQPQVDGAVDYRRAVTDSMLDLGASRLLESSERSSDQGGPRWGTRLTASHTIVADRGERVVISIAFDPQWVHFSKNSTGYNTDLDLALIADDDQNQVVGKRRLKLNIHLSVTEFARSRREWLTYETDLEVARKPSFVRAVLYDFETDRTSAARVRLK